MATYKGNKIGDTKKGGLFAKLSDEGTDLKKLKFKDFLNDVSNAPYVEHDINTGEPVERDSWWKLYVNTSALAVRRRLEDVKRISKFIASPKGILWESERAGLETIQKNLQQGQADKLGKIRAGAESDGMEDPNFWQKLWKTATNLGASVLEDIGLTASILEQVAVSGTGTHVDTYISRAYLKDGKTRSKASQVLGEILSRTGLANGGNINGSSAILGGSQTIDSFTPDPERLMVDEEETIPLSAKTITYGTRNLGNESSKVTTDLQTGMLKLNTDFSMPGPSTNRKNYQGKLIRSGSSLAENELHGVSRVTGSSSVRKEANSSVVKADKQALSTKYGEVSQSSAVEGVATDVAKHFDSVEARYVSTNTASWGSPMSLNRSDGKVKVSEVPESLSDYKEYIKDGGTGSAVQGKGYTEQAAEITINVRKRSSEEQDGTGSMDNFYYHTSDAHYSYFVDTDSTLELDPNQVNESLGLIPFCITTITPDHRTYLNFPAYLDSYDDNYTGEWENVKYVGRPENFYGYRGFTRSINLGFKVVAFRESHLTPLYKELNRLVGATAPSYDDTKLFMRGTLASLTIGDLLQDQLGFIPSVKLSWNVDDPWEVNKVGAYDRKDKEVIRVPHVLTVNLQFTPIEKQEVREDYGAYFVFPPTGSQNTPTQPANTTIDSNKKQVDRERARLIGGLPELQPVQQPILSQRDNTSVGLNGGNIKAGPSPADLLRNKIAITAGSGVR